MNNQDKVLLLILDGWGIFKEYPGNAIAKANTPTFDQVWQRYPKAILATSGESVGLPEGQMGTSEVNHMAIGAGRVIYQDLVRINKAISDKTFFTNQAFLKAFEHVKKHHSTLHIKGLLSPGGVHSHQDHLFALLQAAKDNEVEKVFIHVFADGRDVMPQSAKTFVADLEAEIKRIGVGRIASISGRYYAMDRDNNWARTDKTFDVMTQGKGHRYGSVTEAIEAAYEAGVSDEFIEPALVEVDPGESGTVQTNDAMIFVNFRNDRPRQLTKRFLEKGPKNLRMVTMTQYHPEYQVEVAFEGISTKHSLGEVLSNAGVKQLRVTETEKFAHLTFFLNCKREAAYEGEDRIMLDSYSDIKTHDERPEMRTPDIADQLIAAMERETYGVIFTNWCNADMVGHTSNIEAAIKGCEAVDAALARVLPMAKKHGYTILLTADHGNAEEMTNEMGEKLSAHSLNPVPFILISDTHSKLKRTEADLTDIAPTILRILNIPQPKEMTGTSLV
jgi:2,3-bisphosphoglycerate-independent phosphoglycerate mutase